jgi:hypothetical protein
MFHFQILSYYFTLSLTSLMAYSRTKLKTSGLKAFCCWFMTKSILVLANNFYINGVNCSRILDKILYEADKWEIPGKLPDFGFLLINKNNDYFLAVVIFSQKKNEVCVVSLLGVVQL